MSIYGLLANLLQSGKLDIGQVLFLVFVVVVVVVVVFCFFCVFKLWTVTELSHLDRTRLVNKGFIRRKKNTAGHSG